MILLSKYPRFTPHPSSDAFRLAKSHGVQLANKGKNFHAMYVTRPLLAYR